LSAPANYTVVASNTAGSTQARLSITVKDEPEYARKADLLLFLLPYVQWPSGTKWESGSFELAVLGKSDIGPHLDGKVQALTVHKKPIRIRYVSRPNDAEGCQAVFICASEAPRIDRILAWAKGRPILTLSDDVAMAKRGVMVNLLLYNARVGLFVNPDVASASRLSLGSTLQANAHPNLPMDR
jgi:hypothetical protein